jgi:hypothetical protein
MEKQSIKQYRREDLGITSSKREVAPLAESVSSRHVISVINFYRDLIAEYNCKTPSEKSTAQLVANAHVRVLEYSRTMEYCRSSTEVTSETNGYWAIISKELDRANRQYISALIILKQLKTPNFQINVMTKNAFLAQNQQVNSNQTKT